MRRTLVALVAAGLAQLSGGAAAQSSNLEDMKKVARGFAALEGWQLEEAVGLAREAHAERPDDPLTMALLGGVKMHLGDYAGAVESFRAARRGGAPEALLGDEGVAEAARVATEGYAEVVSEHFIVRYTPGRDEILVPYTLETLEAARERIGTLLGWKPKMRVLVEIYPAASTLAAVSTLTKDEIANSGTIALCRWNRLMVTSPRAVVFGYAWRDTLAHELAHLIIGGASRNTVPIWLHEGIAKFVETAWRGEPGLGLSVEQQKALQEAAKKNKLIPFEKMHPSMAKLKSQEETSLAFSEVFTFIEYMVEQKGWEGMRRVLYLMSRGSSDAEAVEQVFGEPMATLSGKWMRSLKTRPLKQRGAAAADGKVVLKDRADAPDDKLHGLSKTGRRYARAADLLYARGRIVAAQRELEKAEAETRSPLIAAKLAMVALANGDFAMAEKAARSALEGHVDLAGPNVTLAEVLVRTGKSQEALEPLRRAVDINPFDPRIHGLTLTILGEGGDAERRAHAQKALALLSGDARVPPRPVGQGGLVQIEGAPFQRVFLKRPGESGPGIPTGLTTPTRPLAIRPGSWEVELVPPAGAATQHAITVLEAPKDGSTQRITPGQSGS